jgi:hypothetical protein
MDQISFADAEHAGKRKKTSVGDRREAAKVAQNTLRSDGYSLSRVSCRVRCAQCDPWASRDRFKGCSDHP